MSNPFLGWRRWLPWTLLLVALVVGAWPYLEFLDLWPMGSDAQKWVRNADPARAGWADWVFTQRHFIGYRPLSAFSFTLNAVMGGLPFLYRLTDLLLHLGTAVSVAWVYRTITKDRSAFWVVPAGLFLLHPVAGEVIPYLARRSYLLATLFSTLAVGCWATGLDTEGPRRRWLVAGTVLLFVAIGCNEVSFVAAVVMVLMLLNRALGDRESWGWVALSALGPAGVTVFGVFARASVLGHFGGYHKRYIARANGRRTRLGRAGDEPWLDAFEASTEYVLAPNSAGGWASWPTTAEWKGDLALGLSLLGLLVWGIWRAVRSRRDDGPAGRWPLLLGVWTLGYLMLYALAGNWFWRMGYPPTVPYVLLLGLALREALPAERPRLRWVAPLAGVVLASSIMWQSPVLRGFDYREIHPQLRISDMIWQLDDVVAEGEPGTTYWIAVPSKRSHSISLKTWLRQMPRDPDLAPRFVVVSVNTRGGERPRHTPLAIGRYQGRAFVKPAKDVKWIGPPLETDDKGRMYLPKPDSHTILVHPEKGELKLIEVSPDLELDVTPRDRKKRKKRRRRRRSKGRKAVEG